jgi:hypothetical protein
MFSPSSAFKFSKINHCTKNVGTDAYVEHVFSFRGHTNKRYLVFVEEYDYYVYVIKFCLQERKYHTDRFNVLTNLYECSRVLTTIGVIIKDIFLKNPYASFGFIGSNLAQEAKSNTKRFRLYSRVISELISPIHFEHKFSLKHSAYLMVNRDNLEQNLQVKIELLFNRIYVFDDSLI